jgi:hypothetical protein
LRELCLYDECFYNVCVKKLNAAYKAAGMKIPPMASYSSNRILVCEQGVWLFDELMD